jgi:hypothetical protein
MTDKLFSWFNGLDLSEPQSSPALGASLLVYEVADEAVRAGITWELEALARHLAVGDGSVQCALVESRALTGSQARVQRLASSAPERRPGPSVDSCSNTRHSRRQATSCVGSGPCWGVSVARRISRIWPRPPITRNDL